MLEVKKAADIPNNSVPRGPENARKYPFNKMAVGDAFLVPADHPGAGRTGGNANPRVTSAAHNYGKFHNMKFSVSTQKDGSVRVERIA